MLALLLVVGLILSVAGGVLIITPETVWAGLPNLKLASIGTDQYGVTLTMQLYLQGSSTPLTGSKICGTNDLANPQANPNGNPPSTCYYLGYIGSPKDPWTVYDLTGTNYPASTTVLRAKGTLIKNVDHSPVGGVEIYISWYWGTPQASGWNPNDPSKSSFQTFPMTSVFTGADGTYTSQYFQLPPASNGLKILFYAEVIKGPYNAWVCDQSQYSSTAYCFAQSEHYLISVGPASNTVPQLSIWIGQGCQYGASAPTESSTCFQIWKDGTDMYGSTEVSVTLPFNIIAISTIGPDIPTIYVHAKVYPVTGPTPTETEEPGFPAQMGTSASTTVNGQSRHVWVLKVGGIAQSGNAPPSGYDVGLWAARYRVEFSNSATPPWLLSTIVYAVINIGTPSPLSQRIFSGITVYQIFGIILLIPGLAIVIIAPLSIYRRRR